MAGEVQFEIRAKGFEDPILGRVKFEGYEDATELLKRLEVFEVPVFLKVKVKGARRELSVTTEPR